MKLTVHTIIDTSFRYGDIDTETKHRFSDEIVRDKLIFMTE